MTGLIPENPYATLNTIGEAVCNNEKTSKVLCKELLKNNPIEEIKEILSKAMQWNKSFSIQENINTQIGVITVYRKILKKDSDPSILTKAAAAALPLLFCTESNNVQKIRLDLFEQLFSKGAGFEQAIIAVNYAVTLCSIDAFIIQLLTLLLRYDKKIDTGLSVFQSCWFEPELEARELIPFFEVLAEKEKEFVKTELIRMLKQLQILGDKTEVNPIVKEKILLFTKAAIEKDLYVEEIYETTSNLFKESTTKLYKDTMRYPSEILIVFINLKYKRDDISDLVRCAKDSVERLEDNELIYFKQKKLEYIAELETLISKPCESTKSARTRI